MGKIVEWVENWVPAEIRNLDTPCWDCVSHCLSNGYPVMSKTGKTGSGILHRYLYEELFGVIDSVKILVRHKCDNRKCINPQHLELGTAKDNMRDKVERGRGYNMNGENAPSAKLTEIQVREIISNNKDSFYTLGKKYGVTHTTISFAHRGITWAYLHELILKEKIK